MRILIFLLLFSRAGALNAQEFLEIDLSQHCHFGGGEQDEELYVFTSGAPVMERLVADILEVAGGLDRNFILVQTNVESVSAVVAGGKRYLLWSQDYLERASDLQAFASVAHEIGHHVNEHTLQADRKAIEEEEANLFMGYILYRKGFGNEMLRDIFKKENGHAFSQTWGESWLEAALKGHKKAEAALLINGRPFDSDPSLQNFLDAAFPFPPPPCFQQVALSAENFAGFAKQGQVAQKIAQALAAKKYPFRYLSVPGGFAMVTQIEQYQPDGSVKPGNDRWKELPVQENFALTLSYLKSLVYPRKAQLRIFVFLLSNQNFNAKGDRVSKEVAKDWFNQAVNRLPKTIANAAFTSDHTVEMLVYEFEVPEANQRPRQNCPCHLPAGDHLKKSGLEAWLKP